MSRTSNSFQGPFLAKRIENTIAGGVSHGLLADFRWMLWSAATANLAQIRSGSPISPLMVVLNVLAIALWTTGVFASLYAGYLNPAFRVTSSTLSAVVNGAATIMMVVFIDPQMSVMTDDVVEGRTTESHFRRAVVWLVGSRLAGTLLAQLILVPAAMFIVGVAQIV